MFNPLSSLPLGPRISVMSILHQRFVTTRHSTTWAPLGTFFRRAPIRQSRRFLWLIPLAGGFTVYLYSSSPPLSANVLASPTVIPCSTPKPTSKLHPTIHSPAEPHKRILSRILALLYDRIWNPIRTGLRFVQLFVLFLPVIISAPMLLVGAPDAKYFDEKWGALWWYGLLVRQMQAAGPTFIKVLPLLSTLCMGVLTFRRNSSHNGQRHAPTSSPTPYVSSSEICILTESHIPSTTQNV
jgi:aarF domain-containing kinase